jgi:putative ABC transport system permease protein
MFLWIERLLADLRFGLRNLARSPGFAAIAVGSLALGIGASTAMYSVIYAVVLDPFAYKDVDRLMSIRVKAPNERFGRISYSTDQYLEIARRNTIFDGVVTSTISDVVWTDSGEPQRLRGNHVTMNSFAVMGVPPLLGRVTTPADEAPDAEPVAVLGYKFWQRQFGGDRNVIGLKMRLNDKIRTVIGVMPQRFMWRGADVYLPVVFHRGETTEGVRNVHVLGRLKPGVTDAQAEADLRPIIEELKREDPRGFPDNWRVGLLSFKETFPSGIREGLWILFGAVGLLLLIACVNVSNLLLTKAASRQREIAVRASLGASRMRLIRQFLTESAVLSIAGGLLGILFAYAGLKGIIAMVPPNTIPDESKIELNLAVLVFTIAVSFAAAIVAGLAPALHVSGRDVASPLKESGRGTSGGARQKWLRAWLVVGEVALSLMLLVGASLMIRTLIAVQTLDLGIRPDRILSMRIPLSRDRYPDANRRVAFFQELLRRVESVPGVLGAGLNAGLHPLWNFGAPIEMVGNAQQDSHPVIISQTNENYTRAIGIPLVAGRFFTQHETANRTHVAVVNRSFVARYCGSGDAIGRIFRVPRFRTPPFSIAADSFEIIGVVRDSMNNVTNSEIAPEAFIPYTITAMANYLVVATQGNPLTLANAVRAQVYQVDKDQPVTDVKTIDMLLRDFVYARPKFNLLLFGVFAAIGLTLALAGVYGVVSNLVAQRTKEIGVRIALGASLGNVVGMVLGSGAKLLGAGIVLGLLGSLASVRVLSNQVGKLSTFDPVTFVAVAGLLLMAGLAACLWPARRAARVDPVTALRHE